MKLIHQFAVQFESGGYWFPPQPRWSENINRIVYDMRYYNKLDFGQKQAVPRRLLHRVVSEPEEIGVRWDSGKDWKLAGVELENTKTMKGILDNDIHA